MKSKLILICILIFIAFSPSKAYSQGEYLGLTKQELYQKLLSDWEKKLGGITTDNPKNTLQQKDDAQKQTWSI